MYNKSDLLYRISSLYSTVIRPHPRRPGLWHILLSLSIPEFFLSMISDIEKILCAMGNQCLQNIILKILRYQWVSLNSISIQRDGSGTRSHSIIIFPALLWGPNDAVVSAIGI